MLTYNELLTFKARLDNNEISLKDAQNIFWDGHNPNKRSWHTKDWKERRALIIKDACEDCGSKEGITLQHLVHPQSYQQYYNEILTKHAKEYIALDEPINIETFTSYIFAEYNYKAAPMCPYCLGRCPNERMRKTPKYLCTKCKAEFDSCSYYSVDDLVKAYCNGEESVAISDKCFIKKNDTRINHHLKDIKYWYQRSRVEESKRELIEAEAFLLFIDAQITYLSFEKTKTNCKRCAFEYDINGRNLCPQCKTNYKGIQYPTCIDCLPEDRKVRINDYKEFAINMNEVSKNLGID